MKKPFLLSSSLIVTACTFAGAFTASGQFVFTAADSFEGQLVPGYFLENFEGFAFSGDQGVSSIDFSGASPEFDFAISISAGSFWINSADTTYTQWLGTSVGTTAITIDFTSGNVTAVGGNFFLTSIDEIALAGTLTVRLSDGRSETFPTPAQGGTPPPELPFRGFTAAPDTFITSLTIEAGGLGTYTTLDNLYVGTAVPEPSQWGLCLGLASLGFAGIRRWRAGR